jgi:hypothetical protein
VPSPAGEMRKSSASPRMTARPTPAGSCMIAPFPPAPSASEAGAAPGGGAVTAHRCRDGDHTVYVRRLRGNRVGHHHLEPLTVVRERDPDGLFRAVFLVRFDRARARLAYREAHLIKQRLIHAAPARDRGSDKPGGPHMRGQRREGNFDGGHFGRAAISPPSGRLWPRPPSRGSRRPW